jgi:hypothetical protein
MLGNFDGPFRLFIDPTNVHWCRGFAIGIKNHIRAGLFKTLSEVPDEQLRAAVLSGGNFDERRRNESDSQ